MRDQQIMARDAAVMQACQSQLRQMQDQVQQASNVAIDNHIRHLALRHVLENPPPLFTVFGFAIGSRRPTHKDIDEAYALIKGRFADQAKARQAEKPAPKSRTLQSVHGHQDRPEI